MLTCVTCGEKKPDSAFNRRWKALKIRQKSCRDCEHGHNARFYQNHAEEQRERTRRNRIRGREEARAFILEYLSTHPCVDGGETDPNALEFDHIHGKALPVACLIAEGASIDRIKIEIALRVVRCTNDHRRKTAKDRGWFRAS